MSAKIIPFEHWCPDHTCGETIEDLGYIRRVRRYFIKKSDGTTNGLFNSTEEAKEFSIKYGIEIDE